MSYIYIYPFHLQRVHLIFLYTFKTTVKIFFRIFSYLLYLTLALTVDNLRFISQEINIYFGLLICITGVVGGLLNIIVFTTLRTFRQTTCATYLTSSAIASLGQSLTILFRNFNTGFSIGPLSSSIFCKLRFFLSQYFALVSLTSMCMATIDQFLSMSKYRDLNKKRLARYHCAFAYIFWFIHGIFTFIYYDSNQNRCITTNATFAAYYTYFFLPVLLGFFPITITSIFSLLAYFKILTTARTQTNIIRLSRDRQLTAMTLVNALFITITTIPYVICFVYTLSITANNAEESARNQLIYVITGLFGLEVYTVSYFSFQQIIS